MKTTIFFTCITIILFLYVGDFKMSFDPFTVSLPIWKISVAYVLFFVGIILMQIHYEKTAQQEGFAKGHKWTIDQIQGILDEKLKTQKIEKE